jgi:hypothetical protein
VPEGWLSHPLANTSMHARQIDLSEARRKLVEGSGD